MENLISGLLNTALDAASSALHLKSPPSSPTAGDSTSIDRSTWAEIAAGKDGHKSNHEERPHPHAWQNPEQQQHGGSADHRRNSSSQSHKQSYSSAVAEYSQQEESHNDDDNGWQSAGNRRNRPHFNSHHMVPDEQWHEFKRPPHEQHYAKPVDEDVDIEPRQEELHSLAAACNRLWELDLNRLTPGIDYEINCGDGKKVYDKEDMAENLLFRKVNKDVFRQRPSYARFYALLDNYTAKQGEREHVTEEERQEEVAFMEEISRSAPIKYLHEYLAAKRIVSRSPEEFKQQLHSLWFDLYGRGGSHGSSSAFEHVFVGELKSGHGEEVSGFHNWIKFYVEEAAGRIDYQGYILPRRRNCAEPDAHTQCLSIQFTWNDVLKPVSSTFIGVSPEFELALYTLCFYLGGEDNHMELGPYSVNIKCYHLGRDKMGSCFPIAQD